MKIECVAGKPTVIEEEDDLIRKKRWKQNFWRKLAENLISIKVWVIFAMLLGSSLLLATGNLTPIVWGSANSGTITAIVGMREAFKVRKVQNGNGNGQDLFLPS